MTAETTPLVSVIIPMHNSEQLIPQTLRSLLYQTMKNFEAVVVDDCSTDNSVAVVESFANRFVGEMQLRIVKLPENSGTPNFPRNVGINLARGKYIAFLDSDDLYTKTALEELTTLAEKYQADVVHLDDTFKAFKKAVPLDDPQITDFKKLTNTKDLPLTNWRGPLLPRPEPLAAPEFESDSLEERVDSWAAWKYRFVTYSNFCRRDLLIDNKITFPNMKACGDQIFNFSVLCHAKKFLRAPNIIYIIRPHFGSVTREKVDVDYDEKHFRKWFNVMKSGFNELGKVMDSVPFFADQPQRRLAVLNFFFKCNLPRYVAGKYAADDVSPFYQVLKDEFPAEHAAISACMFNLLNDYWLQIKELKSKNKQLTETVDKQLTETINKLRQTVKKLKSDSN